MTLDIVASWVGSCYWGSKKVYPDVPSFLVAVGNMIYYGDAPELSESDVTETRLRHCVGSGCAEEMGGHWHPTDNIRGSAPVWQYGKEY